jgi:hypothetical protein
MWHAWEEEKKYTQSFGGETSKKESDGRIILKWI